MLARSLKSGMRVRIDPRPDTDVAAVYVWIGVGSADEPPGMEGAAHMVEHMVFKGTRSCGVGEVATAIEGMGGELNAWTSFDETVFHATVPAAHAAGALDVLAEMLVSPRFDATELARERKVILEEVRGCQDDPDLVLTEACYARAWGAHPYGRPIIGTVKTVRGISRDALHGFWRQWYLPGNACLAIVGNVDAEALAAQAERVFADDRPAPPKRTRPAVGQPGGQARLRRRFEVNLAELAWPGPGHGHPDVAVLDTLAQAIGGGASAPMEAIVRRGTKGCVGASMQYEAEQHGGMTVVSVQAYPDGMAETLRAARALVDRVAAGDIAEADLARARAQILADRVFRRETVDGRAHALCFHQEVFGDVEAWRAYDEAVRNVTVAQAREVAARWLGPDKEITVALTGDRLPRSRVKVEVTPAPAAHPTPIPTAPARTVTRGMRLETLPNGVRLLMEPDDGEVVAMRAVGLGGLLADTAATAGRAGVWSRLIPRGAGGLDAMGFAAAIEALGGGLSGINGRSSQGVRGEFTADTALAGLDLFLSALLHPRFDGDEVERAREELLEAQRERDDHPEARVGEELWRLAAGPHPWALPAVGRKTSVSRLTRPSIQRLHTSWLRAENLVVAVTGGFDPDEVRARLIPALAEVPRGYANPCPDPVAWVGGSRTLTGPGEQAHVAMAFPAVGVTSADAPAQEVLAAILGGQGGRLFLELRERLGLAYAVSAHAQDGIHPGLVVCALGTEPDRMEEATARLAESVARVAGGEIAADEVARARAWCVGATVMDRQTAGARASEAAWAELYGLGGAEYRAQVRRLEAVELDAVRRLAARILTRPLATVRMRPEGR